jgi:hypothetical protein
MTVLTWIAIGIAALVLVILIVPIRIFVKGSADDREGIDYRLMINWAWGIFSIQATSNRPAGFYLIGLRVCHIPLKIGKKKKSHQKPKKEKPSPLTWIEWTRGNYPRVNHVLSRFAHAGFLKGQLAGTIGLADPADAALIGLLGRLLQFQTKHLNLYLTTAYEYEIIHIKAQIQSTLIIGYLGVIALELLLDNQVRMMLRGVPQTK